MQADQGEKEKCFLKRAQSGGGGISRQQVRACTSNQDFKRDLPNPRKGTKKKKYHSLGGNGYKKPCFNICKLHLITQVCGKEHWEGRGLEESHCMTSFIVMGT